MKVGIKRSVIIELDEQDARWLLSFVQNSTQDESSDDRHRRYQLFETLKDNLGMYHDTKN